MNMTELEMNIFAAPQGYYLAQGISRDLNFKVGLPAQFDKYYNIKEKMKNTDGSFNDIKLGTTYLIDNVFSLVARETSYDYPNRDALYQAIASMRWYMVENKITKLAIPKICCGKNGFNWDEVKELFEEIFSEDNVQILVCC